MYTHRFKETDLLKDQHKIIYLAYTCPNLYSVP